MKNDIEIKDLLRQVKNPHTGVSIVEEGRVSGVVQRDKKLGLSLTIDPAQLEAWQRVERECQAILAALPEIERVTIVLTQEAMPSEPRTASLNPPPRGRKKGTRTPEKIAQVIMVAAGKGGVGKSTVTLLLAQALQAAGKKVAIVDADIYGPSIPKMLGIKKEPIIEAQHMLPIEVRGIETISMGYLLPDSTATAWRGPMVTKALHQLLFTTRFSERDLLLIDMPPGTGDIQISLAENCAIAGAVLVSTPQQVALLDVIKAADMCRKLEIPLIGIVENMSFLEMKGEKQFLFGQGNVEHFAREQALPYLGALPLDPNLSQAADAGELLEHAITKAAQIMTQNFLKNLQAMSE